MLWIIVAIVGTVAGFYLNLRAAESLNKQGGFSDYWKGSMYGFTAGWLVTTPLCLVLWWLDTPPGVIIPIAAVLLAIPWCLGFTERGQKWRSHGSA